jgi:hypothetical protein
MSLYALDVIEHVTVSCSCGQAFVILESQEARRALRARNDPVSAGRRNEVAAPPETAMCTRPIEVDGMPLAKRAAPAIWDIPLLSMSMGPCGTVSRMVGGVFGFAPTFAAGKSSSAPGQMPIKELRAVLATVRRFTGTD